MNRLPPLNYLRSFEAAARHLSFTKASVELGCTQAAVSQHIRALETFVSRPLFNRNPGHLELTEIGLSYLPAIRDALERVEMATEAVVAMPNTPRVIISCPVSFASLWLAPKIAEFRNQHPNIDIIVHGTVWGDVSADIADLRIRIGEGSWGGMSAYQLTEEELIMVCAPELLEGDNAIVSPKDVAKHTIIHTLGRQDYWKEWTQMAEFQELDMEGGVKTDSTNVALEMATSGHGVLVTLNNVAGPYLERGLLVEPFEHRIKCNAGFYLVEEERLRPNHATKLFRDWLLNSK